MQNNRLILSPISPNPLLDGLLKSLWGVQNTQHSPADSLPKEIDAMIAEEAKKAISNPVNITPALGYSSSNQTNRSNRFFQTEVSHTTALKILLDIMLDWSINIYDPNLKAQILCLVAKADLYFSNDKTYQSLAPAILSSALAAISDNGLSTIEETKVDKITQAHIYFTIVCFLGTQNDADKTAITLYEQFQALYKKNFTLNSDHDSHAIRNAFLGKAETLDPTIKTARLNALLHASIIQLLIQPYQFETRTQGKEIVMRQTTQLKQDITIAQNMFDPAVRHKKNYSIKEIMQNSLHETIHTSLAALEQDALPHAIEWSDMALTILMLTKLAGLNIGNTYIRSVEKTLGRIRMQLDQAPLYNYDNHAFRA